MADSNVMADAVMTARDVNVYYGDKHAIRNVSLDIGRNQVLALIGPSGCGKSTFLRCLNRMNDTIVGARVEGLIQLDGQDIYARQQDVAQLRARVGIVFQKPTPFPHSIYANVSYGPRIHGLVRDRPEMDDLVHTSLERAGLWDEVKDRLSDPGTSLSGGQQQRLCIARAIAVNPEVISPSCRARRSLLCRDIGVSVISSRSVRRTSSSPIRSNGSRRITSPAASADGPPHSARTRFSTALTASESAPRWRLTAVAVDISLVFQVRLMQPMTWPLTQMGIAIELRPSSASARPLE